MKFFDCHWCYGLSLCSWYFVTHNTFMYRRESSTILFCNVNYIICSVVVNCTSQDLIGLLYSMKFFVISVTDCRHACGTL